MYYTFKYLFKTIKGRNSALKLAYPTWDVKGDSTQTLEGGDTIIVLGPKVVNTNTKNTKAKNTKGKKVYEVDIVSKEAKTEISNFSVYPNTPDHVVLGLSFSPQIQRKAIKTKSNESK